ncbi:MAG: Hcp family type VI secretion system effector [Sedimentitalea sp.]
MAETIFVKIEGCESDCTEENHIGWIVTEGVDFEVKRVVDMTDFGGTNRGLGNAEFGKVKLKTNFGKASPALMLAVASGKVFPEITIHQCASGDAEDQGLEPYIIWTLKNVQIDSFTYDGPSDGTSSHEWELAYRNVTLEYSETDDSSNKLTKVSEFKWDLPKGKVA